MWTGHEHNYITAFTAGYCTLAKPLPKAFFTYHLQTLHQTKYGCTLKWNKRILYSWQPCPVDAWVPHSLRLPSSHPSSLPLPSRLPKQGTRRYFKWLQVSSINRSQSSDTLSIEVSWAQQLPRNACLYLEADSELCSSNTPSPTCPTPEWFYVLTGSWQFGPNSLCVFGYTYVQHDVHTRELYRPHKQSVVFSSPLTL